jgi:hypothetical protein
MLRIRPLSVAAVVVLLASLSAMLVLPESARAAASATPPTEVTFIVNQGNPQAELPVGDVCRMLLGEITRWPDGRKVTVAMREPGAPEREAVLRLICRMTEGDYTKYLLHAAYRGESPTGLKQLDTSVGVRRFVFNVPGALGFVRVEDVDQSVKVLRISGGIPDTPVSGLTVRSR